MDTIKNARNLLVVMMLAMGLGWTGASLADDVAEMPVTQSEMSVNINEADAATLAEMLTGVGISRAEAIVAYREAHGKFYSAEELTAVRGIGETTVAKNASKIRVE